MMTLGLVMTAVYGYVHGVLYPRLCRECGAYAWQAAAQALNGIRRLVALNLVLGICTVALLTGAAVAQTTPPPAPDPAPKVAATQRGSDSWPRERQAATAADLVRAVVAKSKHPETRPPAFDKSRHPRAVNFGERHPISSPRK